MIGFFVATTAVGFVAFLLGYRKGWFAYENYHVAVEQSRVKDYRYFFQNDETGERVYVPADVQPPSNVPDYPHEGWTFGYETVCR